MADINGVECFHPGKNRFAMQAYAEQKARQAVPREEQFEMHIKSQGQKAVTEIEEQAAQQKKARWDNSLQRLMMNIDARIAENKQWFAEHPDAPRRESYQRKMARLAYERKVRYGY